MFSECVDDYENYSSLRQGVDVNFASLVGPRISAERKRLKLSQAAVAEACGVSREMWGKYERGKAAMGIEVLSSFVAAGADALFVLTGETAALAPEASPDEQLVLEAYRELSPAKRKQLLVDLLSGSALAHSPREGGVAVSGDKNRVAGRDNVVQASPRKRK